MELTVIEQTSKFYLTDTSKYFEIYRFYLNYISSLL